MLTAGWIIGLTNALNLLDNMDGLAAGIGLIAASYLAFLFSQQGDQNSMFLALALVGTLSAFLTFNFHPASIFMGDAGSLFLGSSLSLLAIQANGHASSRWWQCRLASCWCRFWTRLWSRSRVCCAGNRYLKAAKITRRTDW